MPRTEDLRFRAGTLELAATLTFPAADGRHPWAVLVPSWLPRGRDGDPDRVRHPAWYAPRAPDEPRGLLAVLADALAERGVATLRYDPRGCGESDGTWEGSDLFSRIDDLRDAIGAMRSRPELDLRRTAIVGHGEGAVLALSAAIGDPAIGALALVGSPARSFRDGLRRAVAMRARSGAGHEHPVVRTLDRMAEELIERASRREPTARIDIDGESVELNLAMWEQAFATPALALSTMLHRNVVLAHGGADSWAHPDESRVLAEVLTEAGNEPSLHVFAGADHDLRGEEDAVRTLAEALEARMDARELPPVLVAIEEMQ